MACTSFVMHEKPCFIKVKFRFYNNLKKQIAKCLRSGFRDYYVNFSSNYARLAYFRTVKMAFFVSSRGRMADRRNCIEAKSDKRIYFDAFI